MTAGDVDVVVVGAGMAGLAAAARLRGLLDVLVLEASDGVGGRVRTDRRDGFLVDRGFQVCNPAYPEVVRLFDLPALDLRPFEAGALVRMGDRLHRVADPRRAPAALPGTALAPIGSPLDKTRLGLLTARLLLADGARLSGGADVSTAELLRSAGVGERTVERFLRPFLAGVFLEPDLETAARFFGVVWRSFARGTVAVPAAGMGALGAHLADRLGRDVVRTGVPVLALTDGGVVTSDGPVRARAVVVAADPVTAGRLTGCEVPRMRAVTTYLHVPPVPPVTSATLVLDGERSGPVVNSVVLTNAAPTYAPPGRHLVSSSVLGAPVPERVVREHLARMYGVATHHWVCLDVVHVPAALPAFGAPVGTMRRPVRLGEGRYVAGDHRDTPSLQGALVSGRRAADAVLRDLGVGR